MSRVIRHFFGETGANYLKMFRVTGDLPTRRITFQIEKNTRQLIVYSVSSVCTTLYVTHDIVLIKPLLYTRGKYHKIPHSDIITKVIRSTFSGDQPD